MNVHALPRLSFVVGILTAMLDVVPTRAEIMFAESIEWRVARADVIARASVAKVEAENGADDLVVEKATLKVSEVLKGKRPAELRHSVRLYTKRGWEKFDRPSRWKKDAAELLVFLKGERIESILRLDGQKSHGQGYRAFTIDLKTLSSKNSILAAVYGALAFDERVKPQKGIDIDVSPGSEIYPEIFGGSAVYLTVPLDSRLEKAAREWVNSSDPWLKVQGERTLEQIKKPDPLREKRL